MAKPARMTDPNFLSDVLAGLSQTPKHIPSKWFYDERGSQLFDQLTQQPDYYPPHVERRIMAEHLDQIIAAIGPHALLIEYGSGSSTKTRTLLDRLPNLSAYVPIDISSEHLLASVQELKVAYPKLEILPVASDYTKPFAIPEPTTHPARRAVYYPGSTISNFHPDDAVDFLRSVRDVCRADGSLILGVDTIKDPETLNRAYNDRAGVTAAFNLNLLARINRELGGDIAIDQFRHTGIWNPSLGRIESHVISNVRQTVVISGQAFEFDADEPIVIEYSYKYRPLEFKQLAQRAGFAVETVWSDADLTFTIQHLRPAASHARDRHR